MRGGAGRWWLASAVVLAVVSGCGDRAAVPSPTTVEGTRQQGAALEDVLSVTFDDLDSPRDGSPLDDGTGRVLAAKVRAPGDLDGSLSAIPSPGGGSALRFPPPCDDQVCPRAIVEVMDEEDLSPGERDFVLSVVLRLAPDETSSGANVAQKGFSTGGGGQWKLQVDGAEGTPSCVLVGTSTATPAVEAPRHVAQAGAAVADDAWHDVVCERRGNVLTVFVDGQPTGRTALPEGLDVRPEGPVRLGGKNVKQDNDQFAGSLDSVALSIRGLDSD